MAGAITSEVHAYIQLYELSTFRHVNRLFQRHDVLIVLRRYGSCQLNVYQAFCNTSLTFNISDVPDAVLVILADNLSYSLLRDVDILEDIEMLVIVTTQKLSLGRFLSVFVNVINVYRCLRMVWVQVPEYFSVLGCQLSVECLFDGVVMMQVDLGCNPHTV